MICACPHAGFCQTFGKIQSPRQHAICRGEALSPEQCEVYRASWLALAYAKGLDPLACAHRGQVIGQRTQKTESKTCHSCAKRGEVLPVFDCGVHGRCTLRPWQSGQSEACCICCEQRRLPQPLPLGRQRIAPEQLLPSPFQFNNSLVHFDGRLVMAYRLGWDNGRVALAELDEDLNVTADCVLPLRSGQAREDPRLFLYRGELHVSFTAVHQRAGCYRTDMGYARLARRGSGQWTVAAEYLPHYAGRAAWEKNWGFFECGGDLLAVYSIRPHRVLRIEGASAVLLAESVCDFAGKPGLLRGGAPPIFYRGQWYSFYHRQIGQGQQRVYSLDLYTFEPHWPFRPLRQIETPLLLPTRGDRPARTVPHVVFPGGAFVDDRDRWAISFGYYDRWSEVCWFDVNEVEKALLPLAD